LNFADGAPLAIAEYAMAATATAALKKFGAPAIAREGEPEP
jgi:hypothetical protein